MRARGAIPAAAAPGIIAAQVAAAKPGAEQAALAAVADKTHTTVTGSTVSVDWSNAGQRGYWVDQLVPSIQKTLADGKEAFSHYCVACHGNDGQNTGVPFVEHISPPIPSLASPEVQSYTDGQLKAILDYGIQPSGMPGSKGVLSDDELWSIVVFIRHLPPAGSQGIPEIYTH